MSRLASANGSAAGGLSAATSDLVARLTESSDPTLAYRARVLASALDPESEEAHTLRAAIADSPRSRALLSNIEPNGTIHLHPYAKWQGPHWTLVSLALLDYPRRRPDPAAAVGPGLRVAVLPGAPAPARHGRLHRSA